MMGLNVMIYTNATLISPEIVKWLSSIPPSKMEVTLYGASPETYEIVTGNPLGFNQALRGIDLLLSEGINLKLRTTVVKGNAKDFDEIAKIADKRGVELGIVDYISPRRDGCRTYPEAERLSPQDLAEYQKHADEYFLKKVNTVSGKMQSNEKLTDEKQIEASMENAVQTNKKEAFYCGAGKCLFWITWDGRMTPCGLINEPAVFPFNNGFNKAWEELLHISSDIPVCEECSSCSLKNECICCPSRLKNETGFYDKPAKYLCNLAESRKKTKKATYI